MGATRTKEEVWERMWHHLSNRMKQWLRSVAWFDMPWARMAEEIAKEMLGDMDGLRILPMDILAKTVWQNAWEAAEGTVPGAAALRGRVLRLDGQLRVGVAVMWTGWKETARFISWHHVGYHAMGVRDRDGLFVLAPPGWYADH